MIGLIQLNSLLGWLSWLSLVGTHYPNSVMPAA